MIYKINNHTHEYTALNTFSKSNEIRYLSYRYHQTRESEQKEAVRAFIGAAAGAAIPLFLFAKKQKTGIFNLSYGLKEIAGVSAGSIIGGVLGGRIENDRYDQIQKVKEGIFQFLNATIPPAAVIGLNKLTKNFKLLTSLPGKIATSAIGLVGGIFAAIKLSNFICDPTDKEPDRKLTVKDSLANIDDAIGILAMSDFPVLKKVTGSILPIVYILCGYRAGESN